MALSHSKQLYLQLRKYGKRNILRTLGNKFQNFLPVAHYSEAATPSEDRLSKAMKDYLERTAKYDEFMKQQLEEYNYGKEFLANMMGKSTSSMTQKDVDEAIEYLFPSALFVPKARPMMKMPEEIFKKTKGQAFDNTGRPFHFLFYTSKPNYSQCLHDAASILKSLNLQSKNKGANQEQLVMQPGRWCTKKELEDLFVEKLFDIEYEKFLQVFRRLVQHPYGTAALNLIKKYWVPIETVKDIEIAEPIVNEDGVKIIKIEGLRKKLSVAEVTLKHPGTGEIRINNLGIEYFNDIQQRETVISPLVLCDMLGLVDIEATVEGGGVSSQAASIRLGISKALVPIVPREMLLMLKLSGFLQTDVRRRERKKPGQEGSRRKYTWLKR